MKKIQLDLSGAKILAVDDVPANLEVLFQILDDAGYNVLAASGGELALEVAAGSQPELILLDVMMPGIDGYETCRRLKANADLEEIPVVFLTARDDIEGILEGFQAGGVDYVTKPFKKEELLIRIRTHLERSRLAQELAALNAQLEKKVEDRTLQLQLKVRELEGKDRIAQHLLTIHTREETLAVVLEVISDILKLDRAIIYLKAGDGLQPTAAIGLSEAGVLADSEQLKELSLTPEQKKVFAAVQKSLKSVNVSDPAESAAHAFAAIPILRGDELLGLIEVDAHRGGHSISDAQLQTLDSFALQAAVAINDAQVRQDPSDWEEELDEVLELDEEFEDLEVFENFTKDLGK